MLIEYQEEKNNEYLQLIFLVGVSLERTGKDESDFGTFFIGGILSC